MLQVTKIDVHVTEVTPKQQLVSVDVMSISLHTIKYYLISYSYIIRFQIMFHNRVVIYLQN